MDRVDILKMTTCVTTIPEVLAFVSKWCDKKLGRYICVSNVHMCMETFDNADYKNIVNDADLVVADGKPIVWAQKLLGYSHAEHVRGQNLMMELCNHAEQAGLKIGFLGGKEHTLKALKEQLRCRFPNLQIGCSISPPFREATAEEDERYISEINKSYIDILFVGLGCPKQERWMAKHKDQVTCTMIGVGAAFDFISGCKRNAPRWMQRTGLEWFYRLFSEPRRLWKRYLKQNPRFVFYFLGQLMGVKYP